MKKNMQIWRVREKDLTEFTPIFQKGFRVPIQTGITIEVFLKEQFEIPDDFIQKKISTILLNGHPVDEIDNAILEDGSVLALANAMPGLVGAVMRRKGFYASFRSSISYRKHSETVSERDGFVTVKLFNLLMKELGPLMLKTGVLVSRKDLSEIFPEMKPSEKDPEYMVILS